MVALKNGVVQNKAGRPFDRSTGTWEKPDAAENPDVVKEDASNPNNQDTTTKKQTDAEQKQTDAEQKQIDAEQKQPGNKNEQPDTKEEQPDTKEEQPGNKDKQTDAKTKETPAKPPKPDDEILKTPAGTLKPLTIDFYIDGKQVHFPFDDLSHFNELRAQLASGTTLNDDLIRKIKPIFAEARL